MFLEFIRSHVCVYISFNQCLPINQNNIPTYRAHGEIFKWVACMWSVQQRIPIPVAWRVSLTHSTLDYETTCISRVYHKTLNGYWGWIVESHHCRNDVRRSCISDCLGSKTTTGLRIAWRKWQRDCKKKNRLKLWGAWLYCLRYAIDWKTIVVI